MAQFYPLRVVAVRPETRDAIAVTLAPRAEDEAVFEFIQGQYLTFRRDIDGVEMRRSYSICTGLDDRELKIGIKRVVGGSFSNWANDNLKPGDTLDAMPPMGNFHAPLEPGQEKHYLGFAGGSGITSVLGIIKTVLAREPLASFTLVYANRSIASIMFREELEDLKNLHLGRLQVIHILENEAQDNPLFTGIVDSDKCKRLFTALIDVETVSTAFICGPEPMMLTIAGELEKAGLAKERIKFELFLSSQPGRAKRPAIRRDNARHTGSCRLTVILDGTSRELVMDESQSVLEAARAADIDAPYACTAGVCSTCRAKLLEGEVEMLTNHALEDYEVRQGVILTCQAHPRTAKLVISYDL